MFFLVSMVQTKALVANSWKEDILFNLSAPVLLTLCLDEAM